MTPPEWRDLRPGMQITVVKLDPGGVEAARYDGTVVATVEPESWCVVQAIWTYGAMNIDGLELHTGDKLLEWFSPVCSFNAFAVFSPVGQLRGWYANVTHPAYLECTGQEASRRPILVWHDLYLDLIGHPNGSFTIRDRDELDASVLRLSDAALYDSILAAGQELAARFRDRQVPFQTDMVNGAIDRALDQDPSRKKPNVRGK